MTFIMKNNLYKCNIILLSALLTMLNTNSAYSCGLKHKISGTVSINKNNPIDSKKTVKIIVKLLDVTIIDSAATTIATKELFENSKTAFQFELVYDSSLINKKNSYIISSEIHVKQGQIFIKKYITMQSYPVLTKGFSNKVDVVVNSIN